MPHQHRANRMDRLMPVQALGPKSGQRVLRDFNLLNELVLHNGVNGRMEMSVRKFRTQPAVIGRDQLNPLGLIERQPYSRFRRRFGGSYLIALPWG